MNFSAMEGCSDKEISTTDKVLGSEKNMVLPKDINCGCAKDSISSVSTKSDSSEVCQFLETRNDDELVMIETEMPARLRLFKKQSTNGSLIHCLNVGEMPKPSTGLEKEMKCQKSNSCQGMFSSANGFTLPEEHPEDSGYDSAPILNSREFQPDVLSSSDHNGQCSGKQLVKKAIVFNPQGKICHLMNRKIETNYVSTAYQQKTQLTEKSTKTKDFVLRVAVDTPKAANQNVFKTESISGCRRKADQNLEAEINSALKNHNAAGKALVFELKRVVRKPVDFFQSYNDLVKQFRKESAIVLS